MGSACSAQCSSAIRSGIAKSTRVVLSVAMVASGLSGTQVGTACPRITEYAVADYGFGITLGGDGNMWSAAYVFNSILRITPAGVETVRTIPTAGSKPLAVALGPDGNMWFTEFNGGGGWQDHTRRRDHRVSAAR